MQDTNAGNFRLRNPTKIRDDVERNGGGSLLGASKKTSKLPESVSLSALNDWLSKSKVGYGKWQIGRNILLFAGIKDNKDNFDDHLISKAEYEQYCREQGRDTDEVLIVGKTHPTFFSGYIEKVKAKYSPFPLEWLTSNLPEELQSVISAVPATTIERPKERPATDRRDGTPFAAPQTDKTQTSLADLYRPPDEKHPNRKNKKRVVVFGPPGEGKSTLLQRQVLEWIDEGSIPVVVPLKEWKDYDNGLLHHLQTTVLPSCKLKAKDVEAFLEQCKTSPERFAFCFDALDETPNPEKVQKLIGDWARDDYPEVRVLVTCRSAFDNYFFTIGDWYRAELQPLAPDAIREYAARCLAEHPEQRERLLRQLDPTQPDHDPRTLALAGSGICLGMMLRLLREGDVQLPTSRDDLYHKLTEELLTSEKQKMRDREEGYYFDLKLRALEELSFWSLFLPDKYPPTRNRLQALLIAHDAQNEWGIARSESRQTALLDDMTGRGGMVQTLAAPPLSNRGDAPLRFFHQTLLEYFAAGYIVRQWKIMWERERDPLTSSTLCKLKKWLPRIWASPSPDDPRPWLETHAPEPSDDEVGHLPMFRTLPFDPRYRELLLLMVGHLETVQRSDEAWEAWWLKGLARAPYMADFVLQCLSRCRLDHSYLYASFGENTILEQVIDFYFLSKHRCWHGLKMLTSIRNLQNAIQITVVLQELIEETIQAPDTYWYKDAFDAIKLLGQVGTGHSAVAEWLMQKMADIRFSHTRHTLIRALGQVCAGNLGDADHLMQVLDGAEGEVHASGRDELIGLLGQIGTGDSEVADWLMKTAENDPSVRRTLITVLSQLDVRNSKLAGRLMQMAEGESDPWTRYYIIEILVRFGVEDAKLSEWLIEMAENENSWYLRSNVLSLLGEIGTGNSEMVSRLIRLIGTEGNPNFSSALYIAIEKVAVSNSETAEEFMLIAENSSNLEMRCCAIGVLGQVGAGNAEIASWLIQLAKKCQNVSFREVYRIVYALRKTGVVNPEVINWLIQVAENRQEENHSARIAAIHVLGEISKGNSKVIDLLMQLAEVEGDLNALSGVILPAVAQVGIGDSEVIRRLIQIAEGYPSRREEVLKTLSQVGIGNPEAINWLAKIVENEPEIGTAEIEVLCQLCERQNNEQYENCVRKLRHHSLEVVSCAHSVYIGGCYGYLAKIRPTAANWLLDGLDRIRAGYHLTQDDKTAKVDFVHEMLFALADFAPEKVDDASALAQE